MKRRKLPPAEYLRECLDYDPSTGLLRWKARPREHFADSRVFGTWNTCFAGKEAFTALNASGYRNGSLDWVGYYAHRIVWKIMTGKEPPRVMDHKDRNRANNRWNNLRAATDSQNFVNQTYVWSKSGAFGVRQLPSGLWNARVHKDHKCYCVGSFATKEQAISERLRVAKELYGEFIP